MPLWPAWATARNPMFRYETGRWRHSRLWRYARPGLWGVALLGLVLFACLPAACLGLLEFSPGINASSGANAPAPPTPGVSILLAGWLFVFSSGALSALANWLLGLAASALSATLIAREREAQAWPLVRLTNLTPLQIVGGKLAAFVHILQSSMHLVVIWRGVTLAGGVGAVVVFALLSPDVPALLAELRSIPSFDSTWTLATLAGAGLISALYWLVEPYFTVVYNGCVGLAVSTFARTRRWAIGLVFITQFVLGLALYWPIQQVAALLPVLALSLWSLSDTQVTANPVLWSLPVAGLQVGVVLALQGLVAAASLALTFYRVERLAD